MNDASPAIPAEYIDGETALARPVFLQLEPPDGLRLSRVDGTFAGFWRMQGLQIEDLGPDNLELRHVDRPGACLVCRDGSLRALLQRQGAAWKDPPAPGERRRLAAGLLLGIVALCVGIYFSIPYGARYIAQKIPRHLEASLSGIFDGAFDRHACRSPEVTAVLDTLVKRLQPLPTDAAVQVSVVNFDMLNAFALPGDKIILTRELIEQADSPDEIAAVLAHELEHVEKRHVMTQVVRSSILSAGWAVTMGDYAGLMVLDPTTVFEIATLQFSRDDEREADAGAMARLDAARIDRRGFRQFFEKIKAMTGLPEGLSFLTSHPATEERLNASQRTPPPASLQPALDAREWEVLKRACADLPKHKVRIRDLF